MRPKLKFIVFFEYLNKLLAESYLEWLWKIRSNSKCYVV